MIKPDLIGIEVLTPDGRGSILALFPKRAIVCLNTIAYKQEMKGTKATGGMHYRYFYEDITIIKGQYCFDEKRLAFQYEDKFVKPENKD